LQLTSGKRKISQSLNLKFACLQQISQWKMINFKTQDWPKLLLKSILVLQFTILSLIMNTLCWKMSLINLKGSCKPGFNFLNEKRIKWNVYSIFSDLTIKVSWVLPLVNRNNRHFWLHCRDLKKKISLLVTNGTRTKYENKNAALF